MSKLVQLLRSGDFLTRERMSLWAGCFILGFAVCIFYLGVSAHGLNDYAGRPLGTDFSNVYAAGVAVLHGDPTAPFDILHQQQQERRIFGASTPLYGWHYPPFFLLAAAGLALLPYIPALILWQVSTLLLYLGSIWLLLRNSASPHLARDPLWLLLALGFTAVLVNLTHGQNGFLTAALFGSALALLEPRPLLSGLLFGLLCYKPQFAVIVPLVLVLMGRWRILAMATATVVAMTAIVTMLFGFDVWSAFVAGSQFTRRLILEEGNTGFNKIQSAFAWIRLWGGGVTLAYAGQAAVAVLVLVGTVRIWRSQIGPGYKGAALCLGALLITPYSLDYDLMLLAPAITLLIAQGSARGFCDYERLVLACLWIMPAAARNLASCTRIPVAVPLIAFCLTLIYQRAVRQNQQQGK
ncbi:MAG TPA: glycosyltransferase family 87 protein [Rhizomicrobium sp.]|nr:glycosyltransferase family 87 protein [Rhizomicrobium sp.]